MAGVMQKGGDVDVESRDQQPHTMSGAADGARTGTAGGSSMATAGGDTIELGSMADLTHTRAVDGGEAAVTAAEGETSAPPPPPKKFPTGRRKWILTAG